MKVKLTIQEWTALQSYTDLEGRGFLRVMARLHYRANPESGELWLDQQDFEELDRYASKNLAQIKEVFGRSFEGEDTFLDKYP